MNALTNKWINIVYKDGKRDCLSIHEVLQFCEQIAIIDHRFMERVSIIRLLICIIQSAIRGPKTNDELKNIDKDKTICMSIKYIDEYKSYFNEENFLQVNEFQGIKKEDLDDLDLYKKASNTPISFENNINDNKSIILKILVYQNFSHIGLIGNPKAITKWGTKEDNGAGRASVCYNKLISYLSGDSLWETLCLNMITLESFHDINWGKPIWECDVNEGNDENNNDIKLLASSYLGRLVPLSKIIKINNDSLIIMRGIEYDEAEKGSFDPMMWVYFDKKENVCKSVHAKFEKHPWRSLHLVSEKVYRNIYNATGVVTIISGAMIYDKAKPIDEVEWEMQVEKEIMDNSFLQYKSGVEYSESVYAILNKEMNNYDEYNKYSKSQKRAARIFFWDSLNKNNYKLIREISGTSGFEGWKKIVNGIAINAINNYCPKLRMDDILAHVRVSSQLKKALLKTKNR